MIITTSQASKGIQSAVISVRRLVAALLCLILVLSAGCAPAMMGVFGVRVSEIVLDRRSLGRNLDDQTLFLRVTDAFSQAPELADARINITTHNGVVLLTGEIEQEAGRDRATTLAAAQGADEVLNRLELVESPSFFDQANDLRIEAQIKAQLALDPDTPGTSVKPVSERGQVYLLGLVTRAEAQAVVDVVKIVKGVHHIVLAFQYIE